MKRKVSEAGIIICIIAAFLVGSGFTREKGGFTYHDDGSVTLSEGYTAYGFYLPDGGILDEGGRLETEDGVLRGTVNMQQNLAGTVEYGLLVMTDFRQQDFNVEGESCRFYRFSLTGNDEKDIPIELSVSDDAAEFEFLIVRSPDMTGFTNGDGLNWDQLFESKNAYSYYAVLNEKADGGKAQENWLYRSPEELLCGQTEQEGGFDLFKDKETAEVFGEASGGETVAVRIGTPAEDAKECRMVAFCNWEQVPLEGADVLVYPNTGQTIYDEIKLPETNQDMVCQAFLFEVGEEHTWRVMTPSFRMDLKLNP